MLLKEQNENYDLRTVTKYMIIKYRCKSLLSAVIIINIEMTILIIISRRNKWINHINKYVICWDPSLSQTPYFFYNLPIDKSSMDSTP